MESVLAFICICSPIFSMMTKPGRPTVYPLQMINSVITGIWGGGRVAGQEGSGSQVLLRLISLLPYLNSLFPPLLSLFLWVYVLFHFSLFLNHLLHFQWSFGREINFDGYIELPF